MMRTLVILTSLFPGLLLAGCYTAAQLPVKTTPPAATIHVDFAVDDSLTALVDQAIDATPEPDPASDEPSKAELKAAAANQQAALEATGRNMIAKMKAELVRTQVGFPVVDEAKPSDLRLTGTFRRDPYGIALDWQLVEARSGAVVAADTYVDAFFTGNLQPFSDHILGQLLAVDVDAYAAASGDRPTAPKPTTPAGPGDGPPSSTDGRDDWAVVIGIERYREELPDATHAENDARAFARLAETTLGIPPSHIKALYGERAGRADFASVFEEWLPRNATKPGSRVYVFFSGHGAPDPNTGDAYLVPWDADAAYLKTRGYALKDLYAALGRLENQEVVVLLDACFSGAGDRSVLASGTRPLVPVTVTSPRGLVSLSASGPSEVTGAAPEQPHGLFSHHLLDALAGAADNDGDRSVSLAELADYVIERVASDARLANRDQTPRLQHDKALDPARLILVEGLRR